MLLFIIDFIIKTKKNRAGDFLNYFKNGKAQAPVSRGSGDPAIQVSPLTIQNLDFKVPSLRCSKYF